MSGYDYASRSGYVDYSGIPASTVAYDVGRGTWTYERVEQVRRPSTKGYVYSSVMKVEKEGRPREVEDLITKILDEVNGPSVSTTRRMDPTNDYGVDYSPTKGDGGRGYYYEVEYVCAGSSADSRKYGDPFDKQGSASVVYDYLPQRDSGVPNKPLVHSRPTLGTPRDYEVGSPVKSQISRKYGNPFDKLGSASHVYDRTPQRDDGVANKPLNQPLDKSRQTFETPRDYEGGSPVKSQLSRKYGDPFDKQGLPSQVFDRAPLRDYGVPNKPLDNFRQTFETPRDYEVDSPVKSQISRKYGDPFDKQRLPSHVYDHAPQRDYGVPNKPLDNSRQMFEMPREYEVPKNQWERSSHPIYDASPYYPPPVGSHTLLSSEVKPESPRQNGVPNNRWDKQPSPGYDQPPQRDYGVPNNQWINSPAKPQSPKAYEGSGDQWSRPSDPKYDQPQSNSRWGNSPVKPQTSKGYGDPDDQWSKPLKPIRTREQKPAGRSVDIQQGTSPVKPFSGDGYGTLNNQKGRALSPEYEHPPRNEIVTGVPNNRWDNSPTKPQSPKGFQEPDNQGGKSSSPIYDPPQNKVLGGGKKWGNSPLKPTFDQPPPDNNNGEIPNGLQRYSSMKPQSPKASEIPGKQRGVSTTPDYDNRWGNSPMKTLSPLDHGARDDNWGGPSSPANVPNTNGSPKGYEVPKDQNGRSASPVYEHPSRYEINGPPLKAQSDRDNKGPPLSNRVSAGDTNTPVKTESPRDSGGRGKQWGKPSSPVFDASNVTVKPGEPSYGNKANVTNNPYDQDPKGNSKYSEPNKPVGHSYKWTW